MRLRDPQIAADIQRQVDGFEFRTDDKTVVAHFFGMSVESIEHWQTKGMPYFAGGKGGRNSYDLSAIAKWITKQRSGTPVEGDGKAEAEEKYRVEKALMVELQRKELEGKLVDREAYVDQMSEVIGELRKGMDLLVRTWGDEWLDDFERVLSSVEAKLVSKGRE